VPSFAPEFDRLPTGPGKSWNFGGPFSRPGKSWKTAKVMERQGKSWKMMIMSWNFYNCTEKFCSGRANEVVLYRLL